MRLSMAEIVQLKLDRNKKLGREAAAQRLVYPARKHAERVKVLQECINEYEKQEEKSA